MKVMDFGKVLSYPLVVRGMQELCPDIHFDLAAAIGQVHPYITERAGVYYNGKHLCSIDRGDIPEFKVWSVITGAVEIPPADVAAIDMAWTVWVEVMPDDPGYFEGLEKAKSFLDGYAFEFGILRKYRGFKFAQTKGRVIKVGWRHTFERILFYEIPGVTRRSVAEKFGVDMLKYPVGTPSELIAALVEE